MQCPICGEETGIDLRDRPFCVWCESQQPYTLSTVLQPGIFSDWQHAAVVSAAWILAGLLVWAAIYELVKW